MQDTIKSMTGFGRYEVEEGNRRITVEMKAVNHRYLDVGIKMPKKLNAFESAIRSELKSYVSRGKVDLYITYEDFGKSDYFVKYNRDVAEAYYKHLLSMAEEFDLERDIRVSTLSRFPEVFELEETTDNDDALWEQLKKAVRGAAEAFVQTRIIEGEHLRTDLLEKLTGMLSDVSFIEERSPQLVSEYKEKLSVKVRELLEDKNIDEARLLQEVTIFADKVCVDEELVRLRSHIETMKQSLIDGGDIGRRLDFLAQEMNREANTTLSKCNDLLISDRAINLKTEIEKVREQIQNIE